MHQGTTCGVGTHTTTVCGMDNEHRIDLGDVRLVTDSYEHRPDGATFLRVERRDDGARLGWWDLTATAGSVADTASLLDEVASVLPTVVVDGYDTAVGDGVRLGICCERTAVQVGTGDDEILWCVDEIADAPAEVWGAILGAL